MRTDRDKTLVYLADLTHTGVRVATESFPLNIGLLASYAKKVLGNAIEVKLFKYPDRLWSALKERPPAVLGCSNYAWNSNLSEWACEFAKSLSPQIVTVQGGTNYPFDADGQLRFLRSRPHTDFCVFYEGEIAFVNLLRRYLEVRDLASMKTEPVAGCQFISPETGQLLSAPSADRIGDLDSIPSPYVTGLMDEFFDGHLTPIVETARGCPFSCNFCNAGDKYFDRVNKFSVEYVREELTYIAPRIVAAGVTNMTLADNNFGMFVRDVEIAKIIRDVQEKFGWPMQMTAWTGKNSKERVIKATEVLGSSLVINMAVQSLDQATLINIKRDNIKLDAYKGINEALTRQGRSQDAEVIVPLPGETLQSFMKGVEDLVNAEAKKVTSYTLQLLYGTDYKDIAYQERYGYVGKWRVVPLDFGEYEGRKVFDVEQVAVSSNTMSFPDYLEVRSLALVMELSFNNYIFPELVKFLKENRIGAFVWIREVLRRLSEAPIEIRQVHESFLKETREELWDSEEDLVAFYSVPANYEKLVRGEAGGNVVFKHKAIVITHHMDSWVEFIAEVAFDLALKATADRDAVGTVREELGAIKTYILARLTGVLNAEGSTDDLFVSSHYDVLKWLQDASGRGLSDFHTQHPIRYRFYFDEQQMMERESLFRRYGSDIPGLFKILARTPSLNRTFRHVEPVVLDTLASTTR